MKRVGVLGAAGRMGATVCDAVAASGDFELVCAIDPAAAGRELSDFCEEPGTAGILIEADLDRLAASGAEAAVDFTVAASARANLAWCAGNGVDVVCGTTGLGADEIEQLAALFTGEGRPHCLIAPNFAISAVLMIRLAAIASPFFEGVEIIEAHHEAKRDAPSGTALATARAITEARKSAGAPPLRPDPTVSGAVTARGLRTEEGVHLHAVRLPGLVAHQEIIFGAAGQSLTIRQDSYDRKSFMPGVLLALGAIDRLPGLTVGLEALLGI